MMGLLVGISLTALACVSATGIWGHALQIIAISSLGASCVIADLKGVRRA